MKSFVRNCGIVGLLVPVVLYPLWQWVNNGKNLQSQINFQYFALVLWPSSIFLMSLEGSGSGIAGAIIVGFSIACNGLLYICVGLALRGIGRAWIRFAARS